MDIKTLNLQIQKNQKKVLCDSISMKIKLFHIKHKNNDKNKFHIKVIIKSDELSLLSKIDANKKIYSVLSEEMKKIYSLYSNSNTIKLTLINLDISFIKKIIKSNLPIFLIKIKFIFLLVFFLSFFINFISF